MAKKHEATSQKTWNSCSSANTKEKHGHWMNGQETKALVGKSAQGLLVLPGAEQKPLEKHLWDFHRLHISSGALVSKNSNTSALGTSVMRTGRFSYGFSHQEIAKLTNSESENLLFGKPGHLQYLCLVVVSSWELVWKKHQFSAGHLALSDDGRKALHMPEKKEWIAAYSIFVTISIPFTLTRVIFFFPCSGHM